MAGVPEVQMAARYDFVDEMVNQCARGELPFSGPDSLCSHFSKLGFSHNGLYEAVVAAKEALKEQDQ